MRELPILFSGAMVRALLGGSKTQTRRVVKLPAAPMSLGTWEPTTIGGPGVKFDDGRPAPARPAIWHTQTGQTIACPHGDTGDRLWVRETCRAEELAGGLGGVRYIADDAFIAIADTSEAAAQWIDLNGYRGKKGTVVPAIHMPRWASRLNLEVTGARLEQLQDVSEDDARAEGCPEDATWALDWYRSFWDSLNAARGYGWDINPWVWAIEFVRIES